MQGQSSVRLESYLFTKEAVRSAREHLAPGGVFAMYNWYRQDWLVDRYAETLASVFGQPPCVSRLGNNLAVLLASDEAGAVNCPADEVCALLEISAGNQRVLLHRARSRVRAALERHLDA